MKAKDYLLKLLGLFLIILGIIGWFLPLLQGWLLIALGVIILGKESKISQFFLKFKKTRLKSKNEDQNKNPKT